MTRSPPGGMWSKTSCRSTKYPPFTHSGIRLTGVIPPTSPRSPSSTQWKVSDGGTTIIEAPAPEAAKRSMISGSGASVSTSA
ncbi:hypothetical protein ACQP10_02960 [Streptosporangium sandarakinum]|uniref:hypothetical protein n=1 Tax=Streptosporangium sandarakinum TaxID=1260955 RepID=UPI003D8A3772